MSIKENDRIRKVMSESWTAQQVAEHFGHALNAIHNWIYRKHDPMPTVRMPGVDRDTFRFIPGEVLSWAKRNDKRPTKRAISKTKRKAA